jgi:hypothetical protein
MTSFDDEEMELERIAGQAKQLPLLTPSHDLWPGIAARIGATTPQAAPKVAPRMGFTFGQNKLRLALAASLLIAVSSGVTWTLATRGSVPVATAAHDFASGVDDETAATLHLAAFDLSVRTMDEEIALLQTLVSERSDVLDQRTLAVLETNLKVIDRAITESRAALAADPGSQFLAAQFARAYTSKITLLRDAATLPSGI